MKLTLQQEIEQAERAVMRRDERLLERLALASQLAGRAVDRGRWVIGGVAVGIGGLVLLSVLRGRRGHAGPARRVGAPRTARASLWAALPWLVPLLLRGREAVAAQGPLWLRAGGLVASLLGRLRAERQRQGQGRRR